MALAERRAAIAALEAVRESRVLAYVMADRGVHPAVPGFSLNFEQDPFLLIVDHLRAIGHVPRLDLFLYTRGGETDAVWPLVCLLREYTDHLTVLVPHRAHSAGTLLCLGADELVLGPLAELSPIDPTTGNQFNPADPSNAASRYGISVEDVTSYMRLAEKNVATDRVTDEQLMADKAIALESSVRLEMFLELTKVVHPLALGNVERVYLQIRRLASILLGLHLSEREDKDRIQGIVRQLTEEFYSHQHVIPRREAIPLLGAWAKKATGDEEACMTELFDRYADDLGLRTPFSLPQYMGTDQVKDLTAVAGHLDSADTSHVHETRMRVMQRAVLPSGIQVQLPPGVMPPLEPWPGRAFETGVDSVGWKTNTGGT